MKLHKFTLIQKWEPDICPKQKIVCETLPAEMDMTKPLHSSLVSSDEATFHISGKINRHNMRV
jgi:hypothetical protein